MAKAKKNHSITKAKNSPHYELKIDASVEVPEDLKKSKYLFSSRAKAERYFGLITSPQPKGI